MEEDHQLHFQPQEDSKIVVSHKTNTASDVKSQILFMIAASGILSLFSTYLAVGTFDRDGLLKGDYNGAVLTGEKDSFQSWYLLANSLSCVFFSAINVIVLVLVYFFMTFTSCSTDLGYFQKWYKYFRFVIFGSYFFFIISLYLIFGAIVSAVGIEYPFYCTNDVTAHVQEGEIREDIYKCTSDQHDGKGVYKYVAWQFQTAVYTLIPLICLALVISSVAFHIVWEKNKSILRVPNKGLVLWLESMNLDRNYLDCFVQHGVTLRWLKKMAHREKILYQSCVDIGMTQVGDILKVVSSVKALKNAEDIDSDDGVDLRNQDKTFAYSMQKLEEKKHHIESQKALQKAQKAEKKKNKSKKKKDDGDHYEDQGLNEANELHTQQASSPNGKGETDQIAIQFKQKSMNVDEKKISALEDLVTENNKLGKK